ncbi:MAG: HigA family addiction module antitoxin [Rhodospirillaceae bacterium]
MPMHTPPHPGRLIKQSCLEALDLTVTDGAKALDVARPTLSNLLNGKAAISPEMAIRLEKAFGGTADAWVRLQAAYDLAIARKTEKKIKVSRVAA